VDPLVDLAALQEAARDARHPSLPPRDTGITSCSIDDAVETFQRWLHMPDPAFILAAFGAVAANHLDGEPVWLLAVGPPGSGKTEVLQTFAVVPNVHLTGVLTEASLLSGTPRRDRAKGATGGLLRLVDDFGILLCKDFTSLLAMRREVQAEVLGALREIYDGKWTRHIGSEGGRTLHWSGKLGFLAGATEQIERQYAVSAVMGERFVYLRLPTSSPEAQARKALEHAGQEAWMRDELLGVTAGVFAADARKAPPLTGDERERLMMIAAFAVHARSPVERDHWRREIDFVPRPESPGRLAKILGQMLAGLAALGVERETAWRVVEKIGRDCMPKLRLRAIEELAANGKLTTPKLATALGYPTTTTRRTLENLAALGLLRRESHGEGRADSWELAEPTVEWLDR
jgi:hypothetical protein